MMRNTIIILATSLAIGMVQMPSDALARGGSHGGGSHGGGSSHAFSTHGGSFAARGPSMTGAVRTGTVRSSSAISSGRVASGTWSGSWRHRHHHHFRHFAFVAPYGYAAYDSCYAVRRVWTSWGWDWRRVYVCDSPYYDY